MTTKIIIRDMSYKNSWIGVVRESRLTLKSVLSVNLCTNTGGVQKENNREEKKSVYTWSNLMTIAINFILILVYV